MGKSQSQVNEDDSPAVDTPADESSPNTDELRLEIDELRAENIRLTELAGQLQADLSDAQQKLVSGVGVVDTTAGDVSVSYLERTVLKNFGYRRRDGTGKVLERRVAKKGEVVYLTQQQVDKLEPAGVVGSSEDLTRITEEGAQRDIEAEIKGLSERGMLAWLNQHQDDEELDRVEIAEEGREDGPRQAVLEAIESIRAAKDV